jgi:hypothetical protein
LSPPTLSLARVLSRARMSCREGRARSRISLVISEPQM